jgi:hypothetical protein
MPVLAALLLLLPVAVPVPFASRQPPPVPPSHEPAMGAAAAPSAAAAPGAAASSPGSSGLVYQLPAAWTAEKPASNMRLVQASIPGKAGTAQFAIFYFGRGGGGTPEANIQRWVDQMEDPPAPPRRESFSAHGLTVDWVEVAGTMKATTVGMGPATAQPGYRLLGAVIEGPDGPWYAKVTGPDATVAAARQAFLDLLHGLHTRTR